MDNRQQEQVRVLVARIVKRTIAAIAVEFEGEVVWIPQSQIHSVCDDEHDPYIMVTPFIAKKKGLV